MFASSKSLNSRWRPEQDPSRRWVGLPQPIWPPRVGRRTWRRARCRLRARCARPGGRHKSQLLDGDGSPETARDAALAGILRRCKCAVGHLSEGLAGTVCCTEDTAFVSTIAGPRRRAGPPRRVTASGQVTARGVDCFSLAVVACFALAAKAPDWNGRGRRAGYRVAQVAGVRRCRFCGTRPA